MNYCPNCKNEMLANHQVCHHCGQVRRYINSDTRFGLFLNAVVMTYKRTGILRIVLGFPYNLKEWIRINRMIKASEQMEPPWIALPTIPRGSIGWRMGDGESFLMTWDSWYRRIPKDEQVNYQANYPEPATWEGFYKSRGC